MTDLVSQKLRKLEELLGKEEKDKQLLQKYLEEIEDQKEQVNEKERAPYSKKRQSDHRLV